MSDKLTSVIFSGGIPTAPDVEALIDQLGVPKPGDEISYKQIETVINVSRERSRWKTVTNAWRKRLEHEYNLYLKAIPNEGFQCMTNSERINLGVKKFNQGVSRISYSGKIVTKTARVGLSEEETKAADWLQQTTAQLRLTAQTRARELKYPSLELGSGNGTEEAGS